jgi:hypothetical protein
LSYAGVAADTSLALAKAAAGGQTLISPSVRVRVIETRACDHAVPSQVWQSVRTLVGEYRGVIFDDDVGADAMTLKKSRRDNAVVETDSALKVRARDWSGRCLSTWAQDVVVSDGGRVRLPGDAGDAVVSRRCVRCDDV